MYSIYNSLSNNILSFKVYYKNDFQNIVNNISNKVLKDFISKDFKMPNYYLNNLNNLKQESILAYKLLTIMYFQKFNKILDMSQVILNENNKPILLNNNLNNLKIYFNISHSKNFIACVIADFEVGLDIEEDRFINNNSIKKFMSQKDYFINLFNYNLFNYSLYNTNCIKIWNIKEAYTKYLGLGLNLNFKNIEVSNILRETNCIIRELYIKNKKVYICICYKFK